jgi:hypothetical protein
MIPELDAVPPQVFEGGHTGKDVFLIRDRSLGGLSELFLILMDS